MKALGEGVPDTPDSSQVLGTTRRKSRLGGGGGGGGSEGVREGVPKKRSSAILDSIMSIIMVDSRGKEGDTFDAVGVGAGSKRPSVSLATEKLV